MGYPVYKLIRAVNRQYPNNGFINYVDVREDMYDTNDPDTNKIIDEDLRDLINEAIFEVYKDVAIDEVYSFPTVPGQNQYVLPDDCDLRDIQEVTRTFWAAGRPMCPPPPGPGPEVWFLVTFYAGENATGEMEPEPIKQGDTFTFPECEFSAPSGYEFKGWDMNGTSEDDGPIFQPGDEIEVQSDLTITALWEQRAFLVEFRNATEDDKYIIIKAKKHGGQEYTYQLFYDDRVPFVTDMGGKLPYDYIKAYFNGNMFLDFDMNEVFTENILRDIAHPTAVPDPEEPGDNDDGGYNDNPLEDLEVLPIDDGNGGYEGSPLNGENWARPIAVPDDETPADDGNGGSGSNPLGGNENGTPDNPLNNEGEGTGHSDEIEHSEEWEAQNS